MFDLSMAGNVGAAALRRREKTGAGRGAVGAAALSAGGGFGTGLAIARLRDVPPGIEQKLASRQVATPRHRASAVMFAGEPNEDPRAMDLSSFQLDDSSISVIAMVVGMIGGYWINGRLQQLKTKQAKVPARTPQKPARTHKE